VWQDVTVVNLNTGNSNSITTGESLRTDLADPTIIGKHLGGSFNLTGESLEMVWNTADQGVLVARDHEGKKIPDIEIEITDGV
jgi:hypothetical protein